MSWLQLLLAAFSLGKEIIKYLQEREKNKKVCSKELKQFTKDLKEGRKNGDTKKVEEAFRNLRLKPIDDDDPVLSNTGHKPKP